MDLFMNDDVTNPVADDTVIPAQEVAAQPEPGDFDEADDLPLEGVDAEDEEVELERAGKKFRVSKAVADEIEKERLLQSDYTKKTQTLAEERKAVEAEKALIKQRGEIQETFIKDVAKLTNVQDRLAQYEKLDWNTLRQTDVNQANALFQEYVLLKDQRDALGRDLNQRHQQRQLDEQQETAKRIEQGRAELAKRIPNWSPEAAKKVADFAVKSYGFSLEEVGAITDPRAVEALYHASIGKQFLERQRAQAGKTQQPEAQPAPQVGARRSAPVTDLSRIKDPEAWVKERNKQLAAKRRAS
jgi:hypothetical protein